MEPLEVEPLEVESWVDEGNEVAAVEFDEIDGVGANADGVGVVAGPEAPLTFAFDREFFASAVRWSWFTELWSLQPQKAVKATAMHPQANLHPWRAGSQLHRAEPLLRDGLLIRSRRAKQD